MSRFFSKIIALAFLVLTPTLIWAATWQIDPDHSSIQFQVKHLGLAYVRGIFEKFTGTVDLPDQDLSKANVQVSIEVASLNTAVPKRDEHLRSPDFFAVATYPTMTFIATAVKLGDGGRISVSGDLTLRGITKPITLEVSRLTPAIQDPWGNTRRGASATASLDRRDFGLTWDKTLENGVPLIGHEVLIQLELELIKMPDK